MLYDKNVTVESAKTAMSHVYFPSTRNLKAISLASLLLLYTVLALSFFSVSYTETIHRITTTRVFDQSIFGSTMGDSLAAIGIVLLFLTLDLHVNRFRIVSVAIFGLSIVGFVMSSEYLRLGGLATVPFLIGLLIMAALARKRKWRFHRSAVTMRFQIDAKRVATVFLALVIVIEIGALAKWISYPVFPTEIYSEPSWRFAELESALFHSFSLLSPVMLVMLAFSFLYKDYVITLVRRLGDPYVKYGKKAIRDSIAPLQDERRISYYSTGNRPISSGNAYLSRTQKLSPIVVQKSVKLSQRSNKPLWATLVAALVASTIVTLYPHLPSVNESGTGISADERNYIRWLDELRAIQASGYDKLILAVFSVNSGDRPLTFLLILFLGDMSGLPDATIVKYLPVLLAPAFVVSSYLLFKHGYVTLRGGSRWTDKKRLAAGVIAIAASVSPQVVVGLYGGFLANWLALIPAFFVMLMLVKIYDKFGANKEESKSAHLTSYSICLFITLTATMLFHVYTWGYLILVTILFTFISFFSLRRDRGVGRGELLKVTALLVSVIVVSIVTDHAKSSYFAVSSGLSRDSFVAGSSFNFANFNTRWETLGFTLSTYVGGFLSNPIIIILALVWALKASYLRSFDRLVFSTIFMLSIPLLFGDGVMQARLLYVVPLFVPALLTLLNNRERENRVFLYSIVAVTLSLAVYALRAAANLNLVVPENAELENPFLIS